MGPAGPAVSLFRMRPAKVAAGSSQSYTFLRASETNVRQWRCFACARQRWQPAASRATFQRVSERVVRTGQVHAAWPPAIGWFCIPDTHAHTPTYTPTHTHPHTHTLVVLPLSGPQSYANILIQSQIFWSSLCIAGVLSRWPVKLTQG